MNKISAFLKRIGLPEDLKTKPSLELLKLIQYHAVTHIPYENIDIINGVPLNLDAEYLTNKIVTRGRGGYCFELNALLSHILKEMGFEVTDYLARFLREVEGIPVRHHRVVAVKIDGKTYTFDEIEVLGGKGRRAEYLAAKAEGNALLTALTCGMGLPGEVYSESRGREIDESKSRVQRTVTAEARKEAIKEVMAQICRERDEYEAQKAAAKAAEEK